MTAMKKDQTMSTVLAFPAAQGRKAGLRRLDQALTRLDAAQKDQLASVRAHQEALARLAERIGRLEASCLRYRAALSRIDVEPLKAHALRLAAIMEPYAASGTDRAA